MNAEPRIKGLLPLDPSNKNSQQSSRPQNAHQVFVQIPQSSSTPSQSALEPKSPSIQPPPKTWIGLFDPSNGTNDRRHSPDTALDCPPCDPNEDVITFDEADKDDFANEEDIWGQTLIGYIAGRFPSKSAISKLSKTWGHTCELITHPSGWLIFRFATKLGYNSVLEMGTQFFLAGP